MKEKDWFNSIDYKRIMEHRAKNFSVEIGPTHMPSVEGGISLSITHNGNQWSSLTFTPKEFKATLEAMKRYVIKES